MSRSRNTKTETRVRREVAPTPTVSVADIDDRGELLTELAAVHESDSSVSPELSAGDLDARWDQAESGGEETPGGSSPTPDQDVVDEIGKAIGITYEEGEPLRVGRKEEERDEHRWELDPASSEDFAERSSDNVQAERLLKMQHHDRYKPTSS